MKKLQLQHYILLALSVLTLFLSCTAYSFMYNDAIKKAEAESAVKAQVVAATNEATEAKDMETVYESSESERELLPAFLVSTSNAVPFIDAVESIGPATGSTLSISSLSSGVDSVSSHSAVTATITVIGSWPNVMRAIAMIENMPYAISVQSLHLDAVTGSVKSGSTVKPVSRWTAALSISVLSSI